MTNEPDKLAEAIAYFEDEHIVGGSTDETRMVLAAARAYYDLPVVDVDQIMTPYNQIMMSRFDDPETAIKWLFDHLRTTYPQGLKLK